MSFDDFIAIAVRFINLNFNIVILLSKNERPSTFVGTG